MLCNILCQHVYVYIYEDLNDLIVALYLFEWIFNKGIK